MSTCKAKSRNYSAGNEIRLRQIDVSSRSTFLSLDSDLIVGNKCGE